MQVNITPDGAVTATDSFPYEGTIRQITPQFDRSPAIDQALGEFIQAVDAVTPTPPPANTPFGQSQPKIVNRRIRIAEKGDPLAEVDYTVVDEILGINDAKKLRLSEQEPYVSMRSRLFSAVRDAIHAKLNPPAAAPPSLDAPEGSAAWFEAFHNRPRTANPGAHLLSALPIGPDGHPVLPPGYTWGDEVHTEANIAGKAHRITFRDILNSSGVVVDRGFIDSQPIEELVEDKAEPVAPPASAPESFPPAPGTPHDQARHLDAEYVEANPSPVKDGPRPWEGESRAPNAADVEAKQDALDEKAAEESKKLDGDLAAIDDRLLDAEPAAAVGRKEPTPEQLEEGAEPADGTEPNVEPFVKSPEEVADESGEKPADKPAKGSRKGKSK